MTPAQQNALSALAGRALTGDELATLVPLVAIRNDVATAALLSVGRTTHGPTQLGTGTIMVALGDAGADFLDAVEALATTNRNVYWGFDPVRRGVLDLSIPAARAQLVALKAELPGHVADLDKILMVGVVPDPIQFDAVSRVLNAAEGRMTL